MKRAFVIFRGRSWHMCMVKKVGCSGFGSENSGTSCGQSAERASVVMLLLVFGQQIFSPILPIFIVFGLVCSDCCTFPAELGQLQDLGKCLLLTILDGHFYPILYQYNGLVVAAQRDSWIACFMSPCWGGISLVMYSMRVHSWDEVPQRDFLL